MTFKTFFSCLILIVSVSMFSAERFPVTEAEHYRDFGSGPFPVVPGSALDLSFLQDAPAGKYGRLVIRNGHFEFAARPEVPVRLYGVNLCFDAQYLPKESAERLADTLAAVGYNAVRIHHYDNMLAADGADSTRLNPERLDQLDYLAACLKKRGIYLAIDLYCSRNIRPGELPDFPEKSGRVLKSLVAISRPALENWKGFVRSLLTHRNPYTGLTWAEEPALAICSLVNEDPLFNTWNGNKEAFEAFFTGYARKNNLPEVSGIEQIQQRARILAELQNNTYREMRRFLKEELQCEILLSGVNYKNAEAQSFIREQLDYVDNHSYFNHPSFPGKSYSYPVKFRAASPLALRLPEIRDSSHSRIFGKPFTITETNYVYPNRYRSVGGAVLGAFGGYQNYDGIFRFAWSHRAPKLETGAVISYYDIVQDPVNLLSERIGILLFLRNEVLPSRNRFVWLYDQSAYLAFKDFGREAGRFPGRFNELTLHGQTGSFPRYGKAAFPEQENNRFFISPHADPSAGVTSWPDNKLVNSLAGRPVVAADTGQIRLIPRKNRLAVQTPRSEFLALEAGSRDEGTVMQVENDGTFSSFFLTSIDGETSLRHSGRMLLLFLTDVQNSDIAFDDKENTLLRNWGRLPLQLRHGSARISLSLPGDYRLFALNREGGRAMEIPIHRENGKIVLELDNFKDGNALAYELIRRQFN